MPDIALADRDFDRIVYESTHLVVGSFRAAPNHPRFADSGPTSHHLIVFPRTGVTIQHEGAAPFVAGPPLVTFYNRGQVYRRARVSDAGDQCEWFALSPSLLAGVVPGRPDIAAGEAPFAYTHGPSEARVYARQRRFVETCLAGHRPDALAAEEEALWLARQVVVSAAQVWRGRGPRRARVSSTTDRDLVEHAKALLLRCYDAPLTLADIAHVVGCTPFHLCRVFHRTTGWSLHRFRTQVRLRIALEQLRARRGDLTDVALGLGYSSHSHFTAAFRTAFGVAPSAWQRLDERSAPARLPSHGRHVVELPLA